MLEKVCCSQDLKLDFAGSRFLASHKLLTFRRHSNAPLCSLANSMSQCGREESFVEATALHISRRRKSLKDKEKTRNIIQTRISLGVSVALFSLFIPHAFLHRCVRKGIQSSAFFFFSATIPAVESQPITNAQQHVHLGSGEWQHYFAGNGTFQSLKLSGAKKESDASCCCSVLPNSFNTNTNLSFDNIQSFVSSSHLFCIRHKTGTRRRDFLTSCP